MFACQTSLCQDRRNNFLIIWKSSKGYPTDLYISDVNIVVPLLAKVFTRTNGEPIKNHLTNFFPEVTVLLNFDCFTSLDKTQRDSTQVFDFAKHYDGVRTIPSVTHPPTHPPTHSKLTWSESILVACRCCTCCYPPTAGCLLPRDKILTC